MVNPNKYHPESLAYALAQQFSQAEDHALRPSDVQICMTGPQSFQLWLFTANTCQTYQCHYDAHALYLEQQGQRHTFAFAPQQNTSVQPQTDPRYAPFNAKLSQISLQVGQKVQAGEILYVLTAMKMQMTYHAPSAGLITQIHAQAGETLNQGQLIFDWTQENAHEP